MNSPRYRAWRIDPDKGLTLTKSGRISMVEGDASVRQSIFLLLSTSPGERVMRPDYGCDLRQLVFSPNDETTAGLAVHFVRRALLMWEPRVEILRLDAIRSPDRPEQLDLVLDYRIRSTHQTENLTFPVELSGERS